MAFVFSFQIRIRAIDSDRVEVSSLETREQDEVHCRHAVVEERDLAESQRADVDDGQALAAEADDNDADGRERDVLTKLVRYADQLINRRDKRICEKNLGAV